MEKVEDQNSAKHRDSNLASESIVFVADENTGRSQRLQDLDEGMDSETTSEDVERVGSLS